MPSCCSIPWTWKRCFKSAQAELLVKALFLGIILSVVDVGTDLASAFRLKNLACREGSSRDMCQHATHWAMLSAGIVCHPGLIHGLNALVVHQKYSLDMGFISVNFPLKRINCVFIPIYLVTMSFLGMFFTLIRYLILAKQLYREITGGALVEDKFVHTAIQSKAIEGFAEAGPQLVLQMFIYTMTAFLLKGPEIVFGIDTEEFRLYHAPLQAFTMTISFGSFIKSVVDQQATLAMANLHIKCKVPRSLFYLFSVAYALLVSLFRMLLTGLFLFWIYYNAVFLYAEEDLAYRWMFYLPAGLLVLLFPANILAHYVSFGPNRPGHSHILNGWLSIIFAVNYLHDDCSKTKRFLTWYSVLNDAIFCFSVGLFGILYYYKPSLVPYRQFIQFELLLILALPAALCSLISLFCVLYWNCALWQLYNTRDSLPAYATTEAREKSFPPDWPEYLTSISDLAATGHVFFHPRLAAWSTACFRCGCYVDNWEDPEMKEVHEADCDLEEEDVDELEQKPLEFVGKSHWGTRTCCAVITVSNFLYLFILTVSFQQSHSEWMMGKRKISEYLWGSHHIFPWHAILVTFLSLVVIAICGNSFVRFSYVNVETHMTSSGVLVSALLDYLVPFKRVKEHWLTLVFNLLLQVWFIATIGVVGNYCENENSIEGVYCKNVHGNAFHYCVAMYVALGSLTIWITFLKVRQEVLHRTAWYHNQTVI